MLFHFHLLAGKGDFEWSAAREADVKREQNGNNDSEDDSKSRKRPINDDENNDSSFSEKRVKKEEDTNDVSQDGIRSEVSDNESTEALWTAIDPIKPKIMKSEQLPDLEKFWRPVIESPKDFQAWTSMLQYVDHENDVQAAREAYSSFLKRYPYCYGYWKKWADYEKKKAMKKDCEKVTRLLDSTRTFGLVFINLD